MSESSERELIHYLHDVRDRDTFLEFVWALIRDREDSVRKEQLSPSKPYGPEANGWENITIETFLVAAVHCATGAPNRLPEEPSWKSFAYFLYGGKIYE